MLDLFCVQFHKLPSPFFYSRRKDVLRFPDLIYKMTKSKKKKKCNALISFAFSTCICIHTEQKSKFTHPLFGNISNNSFSMKTKFIPRPLAFNFQ